MPLAKARRERAHLASKDRALQDVRKEAGCLPIDRHRPEARCGFGKASIYQAQSAGRTRGKSALSVLQIGRR
eukprot:CAMPEP_0198531214 /NCGR_PEP_ID=MMETSP1462-20131121/26812_1 /TAXON_ID=1333877 /ORGANISM="Brandtodinium nutriculum, Strain RCC3387" /LENGTH=71 /DNA_ID=CAMNT_0044261103 /DNA_START=8 /DNA_END=219 /DNA_ORIENTATION=+